MNTLIATQALGVAMAIGANFSKDGSKTFARFIERLRE